MTLRRLLAPTDCGFLGEAVGDSAVITLVGDEAASQQPRLGRLVERDRLGATNRQVGAGTIA